MSVHCQYCGAVASYGRELGHKSDCPSLQPARTTLSDGTQVYPEHRRLKPNGQQEGYVVLAEEERAKGFVRPVRYSYVHKFCGVQTRMNSQTIAETYARNPKFYSGTFCCGCGQHFRFDDPVKGEFTWDDGERVGS